jgi:hypothetical protein
LNAAILAYLGEKMSFGSELSPEDLLEKAHATFRERLQQGDTWSPKVPLHAAQGEAEEDLRKAVLCWHQELRGFVERPIALEERRVIRAETFEVLCYLDCRDGGRIIDWKWKGRTPDADSVHYDHQLTTYWWAVASEQNAVASENPTVHLACVIGTKTPKSFVLSSTRNWIDVEHLYQRFVAMDELISIGRFEPANPTFSNFCGPTQCCHWDRCPSGRAAYSAFPAPKEAKNGC